jgi:hypothetical protein
VISISYHFPRRFPRRDHGPRLADEAGASYKYRHPRLFACVRIGAGVWLLVLTAILYGYGRGGWWGVLLVPTATVPFYVAYRPPRAISARKISKDAK